MKKTKVTVAVTGLNNTDSPGPGVPVIRALRDSEFFDVRIIGLAYENLEPGIYMPGIADKIYMIPYPSDGVEALLERIEYINTREKIDVLIPNFDSELYTFMKSGRKLEAMGIRTFLPDLSQYEERHKANLPAFGRKYSLNVPDSIEITSVGDINKLTEKFNFPLVVKGKFYDAYIARNKEQVASFFSQISAKWGLPVVVQEFVRGTEVNVIALGDGTGKTIGAVPMRKQYITDKGKAWGGVTLDDKNMLDLTHRLISETKWRGGMELELIKTAGNELFLIEINPRIPAWVYLAVGAGQNLPEALVKMALGIEVAPFKEYKVGKMFVRYSHDLIIDIDKYERISTRGEN
ncbi:MAG: ATP-grasp domain-containing protein [Bacteroidales bacterium]